MKLIDIVSAHIAADEMGKQSWPYDLALALVKVKKATADDAEFFSEKERGLVMQYADIDASGNLRLTPNGTFILKDPSTHDEYERARGELSETESQAPMRALRVKPPAEIRPAWLSALEGFIEFKE